MKLFDRAREAIKVADDALDHTAGRVKEPFSDGAHLPPPREQDNPFARAIGEMDRRWGYATKLAAVHRRNSFVAAGVAVVLAAGWLQQAARQSVEFIEVRTDGAGEIVGIGMPTRFEPSTATWSQWARMVVPAAFELYDNRTISGFERNKANRVFLGTVLTGDALQSVVEWLKSVKDDRTTERLVQMVDIRPTSDPNILEVTWDQRDFVDGKPVKTTRRSAALVFQYVEKKSFLGNALNALGFYVVEIRFRDLP